MAGERNLPQVDALCLTSKPLFPETLPPLRVVAVAAPDRPQGRKDNRALDSSDPASLFNACRIAAQYAEEARGAWARSNWVGGRKRLREKFLLLYSQDDMSRFIQMLLREQPNVLLIGAMTLCMPGAIECAKIAREMFGENIVIILGGRHPTETIYLNRSGARTSDEVIHHRASPAFLARSGKIPPVFDAVVSGEKESISLRP